MRRPVWPSFGAVLLALATSLACPASRAAGPGADGPVAAPAAPAAKPSSARQPSPIRSSFLVRRVVRQADGSEALEDASAVTIGDVIEYSASHRNVSRRRLLDVDFAIALPSGTSYLPDSAQPADGKIVEASGSAPRRMVWRIARIEPDETVQLRVRVSIDPDPMLRPTPAAPAQPRIRRAPAN